MTRYILVDGNGEWHKQVIMHPQVDDYIFDSKEKAEEAKECAKNNPHVQNPSITDYEEYF